MAVNPLQTPIHTNWHVITGAPCSGKTAVIEILAERGHRVVHEVARAYIDRRLSSGWTIEQIKADPLSFERTILLEKVRVEAMLPREASVFLDRAVPDSIAYFQMEGLNPSEPIAHSRTVRYRIVFLLERLTFEKDRVRSESEETAARIETLLAESYQQLGYALIRVPVMSIVQRTDFILAHSMIR